LATLPVVRDSASFKIATVDVTLQPAHADFEGQADTGDMGTKARQDANGTTVLIAAFPA
jgi:hypothetical protein